MSTAPWREPPSNDALQDLLDQLSPGANLLGCRRFKGGTEAGMYDIAFVDASARRRRVVLRRVADWDGRAAERAEREVRTIRVVAGAGVPAPQVLLHDSRGERLGSPSIVMSHAGRPAFLPTDLDSWVSGLAGAMKSVHRVTPEAYDLSYLNPRGLDYVARELSQRAESDPGDSLATECIEVLRSRIDEINWLPLCLVHFDFWPGNVLWRRSRVSAIVDWSSARPGDLRFDVAQCRLEIALLMDVEAADRFLHAYAAGLPESLQHLWFFELFLGLRALAHFEDWWMPAYRDVGLPLTSEDVAGRAREYVQIALRKAKST